jgi:hypothetical protein
MNSTQRGRGSISSIALAFLTACTLFAPRVMARGQKAQTPVSRVQVIAQLPLAGKSVQQILIRSARRKHYLYLFGSSDQDFLVADVSKPAHPVLLKNAPLPPPSPLQNLTPVADDLAMFGISASAEPTTERNEVQDINILDLSDPARPRVLLTIKGVTSDYTDTRRRLIYLANSEGLTIVRYWPLPKPMPYCTSTDAMNPNPDCQ